MRACVFVCGRRSFEAGLDVWLAVVTDCCLSYRPQVVIGFGCVLASVVAVSLQDVAARDRNAARKAADRIVQQPVRYAPLNSFPWCTPTLVPLDDVHNI